LYKYKNEEGDYCRSLDAGRDNCFLVMKFHFKEYVSLASVLSQPGIIFELLPIKPNHRSCAPFVYV
jgi:hypothetical protein